MPKSARLFLAIGAIAMFLAVALGAFGAHALKNQLAPDMLAIYRTGVEYHFYHALGLLLIGLVAWRLPRCAMVQWAGGVMLAGVVLFSGSLYALALMGNRALGVVTPVGGLLLIAAWALLAWAVARGN